MKIFSSAEYFEAKATVIHAKPTMGVALAFREVKPNFRAVLQEWILEAMQDREATE